MSRRIVLSSISLVALIALSAFFLGSRVHRQGQARLRAVLAQQAADGYGDSHEDLITGAPEIDVGRQQRCWAWMQDRAGSPTSYSKQLDESWYFADGTPPPAEEQAWAEKLRPVMEALRAILHEGPVCLTSLGWIRQDRQRLSTKPITERQIRIPNLQRLREAYRWFAFEAMVLEDPTDALSALDALDEALSHPGGLIDAMIAGACTAMRDRTYARLALRGRLPNGRLDAWLAEPAHGMAWQAEAWRGERLLVWAPLGRDLLAGESVAASFPTQDGLETWLNGATDCARLLQYLAAIEGHLRGRVQLQSLRQCARQVRDLPPPFALALGNVESAVSFGVQCDVSHRLVRLGVLLAVAAEASGRMPGSEAEAREWARARAALMDAGPWDVALTYEKLGEKRARVAVDPQSRVPPLLEGTPAAVFLLQSALGEDPGHGRLASKTGGFEFSIP